MINQNQLKPSEEKMVDFFETEELESRLEMCGGWDTCPVEGAPGVPITPPQVPPGCHIEGNQVVCSPVTSPSSSPIPGTPNPGPAYE